MPTKTHRWTLPLAVLLPLAAACGTEQSGGSADVADPPAFTGVHWIVDSVTVDGTTQDAPASAHVTIDPDGTAQGNYGCNHFNARAAIDGDRLTLADASRTDMACEAMDFEETLVDAFASGALSTELSGDRLTLTTAAGDTVALTKEPPADLYGTKWTVTALGAAGADGTSHSVPAATAPHLTFDKKAGAVSGNLGCNQVNAEATAGDGTLTLGVPATTRMMCDASLMDTEKSLLRLFDSTVDYRLDHRTLTLTSENGETVTAVVAQ
ncbi:META domain-containing protein [Streptomyces sp. NPDC048290]|uniref:META domain-containing protein n=1 Tax=Streptomyces sp. NPDC048290 TaxID=3155811 RepID=UPI003421A444